VADVRCEIHYSHRRIESPEFGRKIMAKRRGRRKRAQRITAARRPGLASLSTRDLMAEVRRRERRMDKVERKRDALLSRIRQLDGELAAFGRGTPGIPIVPRGPGRPRGSGVTGRKRPRNEGTLEDALAKALAGRTLGVTEAADAVRKAGYKTNAANFRTMVNQTLLRSDRIKKVARGQYTAA
jgi:hypothetical protein